MIKFDRPTLITITGPTCSGKTHLLQHLVDTKTVNNLISTTSRPIRAGEVEGVDYRFVTKERAEAMLSDGTFIEHNEFLGNHYGVTEVDFTTAILNSSGIPTATIVEPNGVAQLEQVCRRFKVDLYKVYVFTPEMAIVERLNARYAADLVKYSGDADKLMALSTSQQKRQLSIRDERMWIHTNIWDAIVDGVNLEKSLEQLQLGVAWRNRRNAQMPDCK